MNDPHFVRCIVKFCYKNRSFNQNTNVWNILFKKIVHSLRKRLFFKIFRNIRLSNEAIVFFQDCLNDLNCLNFHFRSMHLYINLACLSGCLFVCLYPINVKTAEPIGPNFFVGPDITWAPGRFMNDTNRKKMCIKGF